MKKTFDIKVENKDLVHEEVKGFLVESRKDFELYQDQYREKAKNAEINGEPMPPYTPPTPPEIILSCDLCCKVCGVKCGTLEYRHNKGVDNALGELQNYDTLCDEHSVSE